MLDEVTTGTMIMRQALSMIALHGCDDDSAIAERGLAGHVDPEPSRLGRFLITLGWILGGFVIGRLL